MPSECPQYPGIPDISQRTATFENGDRRSRLVTSSIAVGTIDYRGPSVRKASELELGRIDSDCEACVAHGSLFVIVDF